MVIVVLLFEEEQFISAIVGDNTVYQTRKARHRIDSRLWQQELARVRVDKIQTEQDVG